MKTKIMVVDDDGEIRSIVRILLEGEGYEVVEASSGEQAQSLMSDDVSLMILDVMMPGPSGYAVCAQLRKNSNIPVLFLTAKSQESDMTLGFTSGGDDYLTKPFSYTELLLRIKGLLRRFSSYGGKEPVQKEYYELNKIKVHATFNEVTKEGQEVLLTETEYQILRLMLAHRGKIFSAENIYKSVWEEAYYSTNANTVMVHIRRLRSKLEDDPQNPVFIRTVWGRGYRIE